MRIGVQAKPEEFEQFFSNAARGHMDACDAAVLTATASAVRVGRTIIRGSLSGRAANTLTSKRYLGARGGGTQGAVGYVYGRWWRKTAVGTAPSDILAEFETGTTLTPKRAGVEALAIPLPAVRRWGFNQGRAPRARVTPRKFEEMTGLELFRLGNTNVLATNGTKKPIWTEGSAWFTKRKLGTKKQRANPIAVFLLRKVARLPKRLDFAEMRRHVGEQLGKYYLIELSRRGGF